MAGDQSISLLKDEPPGAYAYGWVFGGLVPGNSFLVSFYMKAFSAEACNLYYSAHPSVARLLTPNWFSEARLVPSYPQPSPAIPVLFPPKEQAYMPQNLSEETDPNLAVKFILGREKVSLTGHNRYKLFE